MDELFKIKGTATSMPEGGQRIGHVDLDSGEMLVDLSRVRGLDAGDDAGAVVFRMASGIDDCCCNGDGGDFEIRPGAAGGGRVGTLVIRNAANSSHGVPDFDCCGCAGFPVGAIGRATVSGFEVLVVKAS